MSVMIRRAGKQDIDAMISLLRALFSLETDFVIDENKQRAGLSLLFGDSDKNMIFVAVCESQITGMVTAQLVVSTAAGGSAALLEDMIVREDCRRRGIGSALLGAVRAWADEKGAKRIQLLADQRNRPALAFYERFGFAESFMRGHYLVFEGKQDEQ